jgi:hypothetical protein
LNGLELKRRFSWFSKINQHGFGTVESYPLGENTLVLAAPGFPTGKNEIFPIEHITACCSRSKKLDIMNFNWSTIYIIRYIPPD